MPPAFERLFDPFHFLSHEGVPIEAFDDPAGFYKENWKSFPALDPHPLFDQEYYLAQLTEAPDVSPLEHYLDCCRTEKPDPNLFFDQAYYEATQMVAIKGQLSALEHFIASIYSEHGTQPNPAFDARYFKRHNPDLVNTKRNPIEVMRLDADSGLRIYGKPMTKRLIKALALDQGPRRNQYRFERYILLVTSKLENPDALERMLISLKTKKENNSAEIIAISVSAHQKLIKSYLGEACVSGSQDIIDEEGVISKAALALNLKCLVSPFKKTTIVSDSTLSERLLFGVRNLTLDDVEKIHTEPAGRVSVQTGLPKVIIPINSWQISGVNTWVTNISQGLHCMGFDVELLCTHDFYRFTSSMALPGGKLKLLQAPLSKTPLWWAAVNDYIQSQENVVILSAFDFRFNAIASVLPKRIPVIGVIHSDDPEYYRACEHLGGFWQHIIAVSEHIRARLQEKHPQWSEKITKVNYGIKSWDGDLPVPKRPSEPIRIIYTGRIIHEQKRILDLPYLLQELDAREVDFQLDLVGNGKDEEELLTLIQKWVDRGDVIMHGRRNSSEIDCLLTKAHVFLLISDFEGLPLSLLEAMAHGVVPVVSDIDSGIPEVIHHGETGYRLSVGDYAGFAETIARLAESTDEWESLSRSTRDFFENHLTREIVSERTAEIIRKVTDPKNYESFQASPLPPERIANKSGDFGDIVLDITLP